MQHGYLIRIGPHMQLNQRERRTYRWYAELGLPRHTSYPTVPFWGRYGQDEFGQALERSNRSDCDLSLYVHVPFCERLCYYCSCTREILPKDKRHRWDAATELYLERLEQELIQVAQRLDPGRRVRQLHLGGGTPTYLSPAQLARLMHRLHKEFSIDLDAEVAIEIDPRVTSWDQLHALREMGFNRVSLGVQDFDPRVQSAVNRVQSSDLVAEFVGACRRLRFHSINFDLIYGLPFQTPKSVAETVRKTIAMSPDRVAFYRMALIPELFRWQKVFKPEDLPTSDKTLEMFLSAIEAFQGAGYRFIGLDHFAKPDDSLAQAYSEGTLVRTFQGMITGAGLDVLGFGPSAISIFRDAYAQNAKTVTEWSTAIDLEGLAAFRGLNLSHEDLLRQALLQQLYCYAQIDKTQIEAQFQIRFGGHFSQELKRLSDLEQDGLVEMTDSEIHLTNSLGRLLVRAVAAVFDAYLPADAGRNAPSTLLSSKVG